MQTELTLSLTPDELGQEVLIRQRVAKKLGIAEDRISQLRLLRRSIDARKQVLFQLRYAVWVDENPPEASVFEPKLQNVAAKPEIHIVGLGPAGLFAALECISLGYKPIVIERGKPVRERRRDLAALNKQGVLNPESNYCFGEGGAGTFSDGKLYTRSTKRGDTQQVLQLLHYFGATSDILIEAHPHIGTNKLPGIIQNIRNAITDCGGEVWFDAKLTDVQVENGKITQIQLNEDTWLPCKVLILATGHSARDIFYLLDRRKIELLAKPFALGVRVEHPQNLIDRIQYHCPTTRHEALPAASYGLVRQVGDRGVYSFCMCPGGIICPASTAEDLVVVNGWSPSKRDSPFANSGIVVEVRETDWQLHGQTALSAMLFQQQVEKVAYQAGGGKQVAPAQRLSDFVQQKASSTLPSCSYLPGITSVNLHDFLPSFVAQSLREGFRQFGKMLKGYLTNEAVVVGVESRTSSPVKIPRDNETLMHPHVSGLFPCGEGAGYAGGIMSAAIDGQKCVRAAVALF